LYLRIENGANSVWLRRAFVAAAAIGLLTDTAGPACARRHHHHNGHHSQAKKLGAEKAQPEKAPNGSLFAVVSIADQRVSFFDADGLWARGRVSTGVSAHPTPTGLFVILEKERWHRSNLYGGAPMPFMQRLTWTGMAMHEGVVPGRPASHGCIRLQRDFAKRLFSATQIGQRVVIAPREIEPVDVSHAHLPSPKLQPESPAPVAAANSTPATSNVSAKPHYPTLLNPIQVAQTLNKSSEARIAAANTAEKAAALRLTAALREAHASARNLKMARNALLHVKKAEASKALAEKTVAEATQTKAAKERELADATTALHDARETARTAETEQKEAARRLEPLSMLVSRQTGRLYVRQGFQTLFEAPVAIRDPEKPLGTHMFVARRAEADGASLHWSALTVPAVTSWETSPSDERRSHRRRRSEHARRETATPTPMTADTAAGALDRVEIPVEGRQRISELLWTGATLIISDLGPSGEGRFAMDFQILTHARGR
jgi:hypothetical protein